MRSYRFQPPTEPGELSITHPRESPLPEWVLPGTLALLVAGSGILNLLSLLGGLVACDTPQWVQALFPIDFTGMDRYLTLALGFLTTLSAVHLVNRKHRALQLAFLLAAGSALLNTFLRQEFLSAAGSAMIAAALLASRSQFPVRSAAPSLAGALRRAAAAVLIAGTYGVAGFWLLDPREFGRQFHWWEAMARTIQMMVFLGDPTLIPRTAYAGWFLDSVYVISAAAFLYCGFILFRPVSYFFSLDVEDQELAKSIAQRYGRSGQDFFKLGPDKSYFFSASGRSFLAYRVARRFALVLGDPVGPVEEMEQTVREFAWFCRVRGWRVAFHQVPAGRIALYEKLGFRRLRIGDDAIVDLKNFSLQGSQAKEFRNTVNRLDRLGYRVERLESPVPEALLDRLQAISDDWLSIPGNRERGFTLGSFEREYVRATPVYAVFNAEGGMEAFLNLIPSFQPGLTTVDLMRRRPAGVNGVMDYLFAKTFLDLKADGYERFSLGMAPVTAPHEGERRTPEERLVGWGMRHVPFLFRADSLRRYKAKYAQQWEPVYDMYQRVWDLPRLGLALRQITETGKEVRSAA